MTESFRWKVSPGVEGNELSMAGPVDELTDFDAIFDALPAGQSVRIDLSQVHRISSLGVRGWIVFMDKLKAHERPVQLIGCSVCIVRQMNMISQFRGHGAVRSVHAPYYCASCNKEQLRLIEMNGDIRTQLRQPATCPTCGNSISLDEEEELYTELQV